MESAGKIIAIAKMVAGGDLSSKISEPAVEGTNGQVLTTDGHGTRTWSTVSGGIPEPSSPSAGDFLVYNGSAWVAQSLSTWQGGSY